MFIDREDAAHHLAEKLKGRVFRKLLILAIPRGGVVTGAVLARDLNADLDVVLSRKLRSPGNPEYALGAISEDGRIFLNPDAREMADELEEYLKKERFYQMAEINRRKKLFRGVRPQAPLTGRSVIVTDDGIATGSTMMAALRTVREQKPHKVIVAVPVASPDRLAEVLRHCDEVACLLSPEEFWAIGQFYRDFSAVEDKQVVELLRQSLPSLTT